MKSLSIAQSFSPRVRHFSVFVVLLLLIVGTLPVYGEEDCDEDYYGLNGKVNFSKAFKCYQRQHDMGMLILMHLNGEGTAMDVDKAEQILNACEKLILGESEIDANSEQGCSAEEENAPDFLWGKEDVDFLRKTILARKKDPKHSYKRIDYCTDLASGGTQAMSYCSQLNNRIEVAKLKQFIDEVKAKLDPQAAKSFDALVRTFDAFVSAESERTAIGNSYWLTTWYGLAADNQASLVRDGFQKLITQVIKERNLKTGAENLFKIADQKLNKVYRNEIANFEEVYNREEENLPEAREEYRKALKKAQLAWIAYRDAWIEVVRAVYKDQAGIKNLELGILTSVTESRANELPHGLQWF